MSAGVGWYPDWYGQLRWWDGVWTEHLRDHDLTPRVGFVRACAARVRWYLAGGAR